MAGQDMGGLTDWLHWGESTKSLSLAAN